MINKGLFGNNKKNDIIKQIDENNHKTSDDLLK
jgi:hypothetical protein